MVQYAESWLQIEAATGGRTALQGSASEIREQFGGLFAALSPGYPPPSDAVRVSDGVVKNVRYRVYTPNPGNGNTTGPLPLGVFLHGGGLIMGNLDSEDFLCRAFSEQSNTILVSVDYRLAPEHAHPAQFEDTMTVLEWAHANASSLGADRNKIYTIGTSAGGTLALLAARAIVSGKSTVHATSLRGVIAVGPVTLHPDHVPAKFQAGYNSYKELGEGAPVLTRATMTGFLRDAGLAPTDASGLILLDEEAFAKFPPVYISTAECDPLRDDGRTLAGALKGAGVSVREDLYRGLPHAFWFFNTLPEWEGFVKNTVAGIRWILEAK